MGSPFRLVLIASALLAGFPPNAFASIEQAPPNFPYRDGDAVFVDFQRAKFSIVYNFAAKSVTVESEILFDAPASGYPIFDLLPEPREVRLDDREASVALIADPDSASYFRVLETRVSPGSHRLTLTHTIEENVIFRANGVASAFWMSDLTDRHYLEQYLPANLLYDQYPISMRVEVRNAVGLPHTLRANGAVKVLSENVFEVEFPSFYAADSVFFHLSPKDSIPSASFTYPSLDGRALPVEVYSSANLAAYVAETKRVLADLEGDFGPFPHAKVIVYGSRAGGMEYAGATISSPTAIGHELFHSYNARGVMPADGNSGWMDEAMSCWHDRHYAVRALPGMAGGMAGHSPWMRITDSDAYAKGTDFVAWIAGRMDAEGKDFKAFLRGYLRTNLYQTVTTELFREAIERYSGFDLRADFDEYIYGRLPPLKPMASCGNPEIAKPRVENPYHPRLSKEDLRNLL